MEIKMLIVFLLVLLVFPAGTQEAQGTGQKHKFKEFGEKGLNNLAVELSDVDTMFADDLKPILIPRVSGTENNKKVRQHITSRLEQFGWKVELDEFTDNTPKGEITFTNVIATYNPQAKRRLVLACHFDSKDMSKEKFEFLGAIDSAVPCAIMIDLAKHLQCLLEKGTSKKEYEDLTLQMLFLDGEEAFEQWTATDSIYGARHLAQRWEKEMHLNNPSKTQIQTIEAFILLDLIGTSDTHFVQFFDETKNLYEKLYSIEQMLKKKNMLSPTKLTQEIFSKYSRYGGIEDDHIPFLRRGVPILHLISAPFPQVWHTRNDNFESLDKTLIDNLSRILRVFIAEYLHLQPTKPLCKRK